METSWDERALMPSAHANNGPATNAQWVRESRCPAKPESPSLSPVLQIYSPSTHPNPTLDQQCHHRVYPLVPLVG